MRFGLISDVHANLPALTAVTAELERRGVERYVCAGDVIGYGPRPDECVFAVEALDPVWVLGNHELMLLGRLPPERASPMARNALEWTRENLSGDALERLARLPLTALLPEGIVVAHASLSSPSFPVHGRRGVRAELLRLREAHPAARILVLGHTHRAMAADGVSSGLGGGLRRRIHLEPGRTYIVNPGSVGQSRGFFGNARAAVLDTERETVEMLALRYATADLKKDLVTAGLPADSHHRSPWGRLGRRLRRKGQKVLRRGKR